eukprot:5170683-Karenia_brevis.AAC.1
MGDLRGRDNLGPRGQVMRSQVLKSSQGWKIILNTLSKLFKSSVQALLYLSRPLQPKISGGA